MYLQRFFPINRKAETASDPYTPTHNLPGRDSVGPPECSPTDTLGVAGASRVATPSYSKRGRKSVPSGPTSHLCEFFLLVYYRIYAEDGVIPSKTPVSPGDPFLARIEAESVPPPLTVKAVKGRIAKVENIKDCESTSLFLTPHSQSPINDNEKVTIFNGTGPGSRPQEPLAVVAKMSDSERSALESDGRVGLANAAEPNTSYSTMPSEIRYGT